MILNPIRVARLLKLLSAIRKERPELWAEIEAFANGQDRIARLMAEAERDYRDEFEGNLHRFSNGDFSE